jgi:adenylate kinase family enzyme
LGLSRRLERAFLRVDVHAPFHVSRRVLVVGPAGSGKTTVAAELARRAGLPFHQLDHLLLAEEWQQLPAAEARAVVSSLVALETWIIDGNYARVRDLAWRRADLVVWLDLPLLTTLPRLFLRTIRRLLTREDLGSGNQESFRRLLSRKSILVWAARSHARLRAEYERALTVYGNDVCVIRLRSRRALRAWISRTRSAFPSELAGGTGPALAFPLVANAV